MINFRRRMLLYLLGVSDLALLGLSLYISVFENASLSSWSVLIHKRIQVHTFIGVAVLLFSWHLALSFAGLYRSRRLVPRVPEAVDLVKAAAVTTVLLAAISFAFGVQTVAPALLPRFFCLAAFSLVAWHLVMRQFLKSVRRHGRNLRHIVIVGTNARAIHFARSILSKPEFGYRLVGFVDDAWVGPAPLTDIDPVLVSSLAGFRPYLCAHVVDEVAIALPIKSFYDRQGELLQICQEQGVVVRILSDLFPAFSGSSEMDEVAAAPVVTFCNTPSDALPLAAKRSVDILLSTLLILLFSPVMLAALILIKLESKGPWLFVQERIGLNKRRFRIYKFRSMVVDAETLQARLEGQNQVQGPVFKIKNDPRITRVGKFLRKTSIDELPQLFNVLKGDMSLVGPRPLPIRDFTGFSEDWQRRRFSVRPGVTCLWQISGRSSISFDQWMRLDMEYIDRWSFWLDMQILARTLPAVVRGTGAA